MDLERPEPVVVQHKLEILELVVVAARAALQVVQASREWLETPVAQVLRVMQVLLELDIQQAMLVQMEVMV